MLRLKMKQLVMLAASVLILAGCATGPTVRSDAAANTNFSAYKSFGFMATQATDNAEYTPGKIVAKMPENATRAMKARHGIAMPAGNEAAGIVVAAGEGADRRRCRDRCLQHHRAERRDRCRHQGRCWRWSPRRPG